MSLLSGTHDWSATSDPQRIVEQFQNASRALAAYGNDGQRIYSTSEARGKSLSEIGSIYFNSLPIEKVADLVLAIEVVWRTPIEYYGNHLDPFLHTIPIHNRDQDTVASFLEGTHEDALWTLLERVWRSPADFIRNSESLNDLADRVMSFCLPATVYSAPLTPPVLEAALQELALDVENCKSDSNFGMQIATLKAQNTGMQLSSREIRNIQKAFRKRQWTPHLAPLYEFHCNNLNERLGHLSKFISVANWTTVSVPVFASTRPKSFD